MSQYSQASTASTVPYELLDGQDPSFIDELNTVDELYFLTRDDNSADFHESFDNINYESDIDSDGDELDLEVATDPSFEDQSESNSVSKFINETCGCSNFYAKPCSKYVDIHEVLSHRQCCKEMDKDELDIVIKSQLVSHRKSGSETDSKKHISKVRQRSSQEYYFKGNRICRNTFCFIHGISKNTLQRIALSLDTEGLKPRVHGNTKKMPANSLTFADRQRILSFILSYASDNALPLPGRLPNFKQNCVLLLPSDKNVVDIHCLYQKSAVDAGYRSVSLSTFRRIWNELCPHVTLAKPCTDLCQRCQQFANKIANSGKLAEEEKSQVLQEYNVHISLAKNERDYYRQQVIESKEIYAQLSERHREGENGDSEVSGPIHYSWDYAQQVHYPHQSQQCGPIYFRTPRKCNVFGVCCEASGEQVFYLIDEAEQAGKGANSVISMVDHYLKKYGLGEKTAHFHFDNCTGQNKNSFVIWYALWRILSGLHTAIELSCMLAGHTKFEPDWHFGVWKCKWRNSTVDTLEEIAKTVTDSSRNGHNIPQLINDPDFPVQMFDWKSYLSQYFKPLRNITSYQHFYVSSTEPGVVFCKEHVDSPPQRFDLQKKGKVLDISVKPTLLVVPGLDANRQWYLYEQIREFCSSDSGKAVTCPLPQIPKVVVKVDCTENIPSKCNMKRKSSVLC